MNKANECTCPSGDGSLVHPCPAHPAVEQAGGDERAVDGKPRATKCPDCGEGDLMPGDLCACGYETDPAAGYACSECDGSGDGYVGEVCRECDGSGWFVTPEQARAALAQPSPALPPFAEKVLAKLRRFYDCASDFESGGVDIGRHWFDLLTQLGLLNRVQRSPAFWEISQQGEDLLGMPQPSPAQAEQAEAERPEVVAYRTIGRHEKHQHPHYALNYYKQNAEDQAAHWRERGCEVSEDELMTVAQHDRIVGALRAEIAQLRQHKNDYMDAGQETYRALQNEIREREAEIARLDGLVSGRTAERDAALAEVERLRQFERICEGLPQDAIDGGWTVQGIRCYAKRLEDQLKSALARVAELTANRNRYGVDAHYFNKNLQRILRDFESFTPDELARSLIILAKVADEKVVAQHSVPEEFIGRLSEFLAQRGATGKALLRELRDMLAAAPARGQHSVPEEFSFEYRHPNGECHTVTVSREQVINEMPDFLFEALCSKFCNCEPVGETNVVECRCDEYAEEFKLLAAAPGKEGL
ncbi:hypothetical protein L5593_001332 [Pseudomonas aeruginosa]|nr:hypothetical protein [Pseudomonas aeruginosa]